MSNAGWVTSILQIMLIKSIIETDVPPCLFTSEHCLSAKNVSGYGEDAAVLTGRCLNLKGTIVRHDAHWLKAETRNLIVAYPLRPSQSISPGFTFGNAMIGMDFV